MRKILLRLGVSYLLISLFLYCIQDLLLFPMLTRRLLGSEFTDQPPPGISRFSVDTKDGDQIEVWTTYGANSNLNRPYVGVIFHGNGETVAERNYLPFFARHNIPAFTFDYRGTGVSTGWPSESKILSDAELLWYEIEKRTGVSADHAIILGNSIGTGAASFLAERIQPRALIIIAGYASIQKLAASRYAYRPFLWLLRYQFSTEQYLSNLKTDCAILAHGGSDQVIGIEHIDMLSQRINPKNVKKSIILKEAEAGHNDIFYAASDRLDQALEQCL